MTVGDLSDPAAVEEALSEFDRIGREAFLEKYGYGMAHSWVVIKHGREYDSKAIAGAAHGYQFGQPLRYDEFTGGGPVVRKLRALGFRVDTKSDERRAFIFQANPRPTLSRAHGNPLAWDFRSSADSLPTPGAGRVQHITGPLRTGHCRRRPSPAAIPPFET